MGMVSNPTTPSTAMAGSLGNKKSTGKVPKKIHKAEREKLKRDYLNQLFVELGDSLEPDRQNNGKACILSDTARLLRDLITQVESLRKENDALVTEYHYVAAERAELKDENMVLEVDISRLENELQERMRSEAVWCNSTGTAPPTLHQPTNTPLPTTQTSVSPLFVIPFHQDLQPYPEPVTAEASLKQPSHVRKPHARYPTPLDSWPLEILHRHPRATQDEHNSGSSTSSMSNGSEEGSDKSLASPFNKL